MTESKTCPECGKTFHKKPGQRNWFRRVFCGTKCAYAGKIKRVKAWRKGQKLPSQPQSYLPGLKTCPDCGEPSLFIGDGIQACHNDNCRNVDAWLSTNDEK